MTAFHCTTMILFKCIIKYVGNFHNSIHLEASRLVLHVGQCQRH
ncbi:unnamed protein product [Schistosoma mattheei]|uniref:Uncharacterized protein n=3 Tax=Schistosoma TaxID=6181 RepID=A0A183JIT9_9TREM|nr:unnamed protein product [Schistosoma margrebowiei]VDO75766.1 unnamed protein product [Schistosoma curassoni]VDP61560.1 unnamed protein product [Schistosoma mattheei]